MNIQIEDVKAGTPPLVTYKSKYEAIHKRILTLKVGERFRATLESNGQALWARTSALSYAFRNRVVIKTSLADNQIEITRLEDPVEWSMTK